MQQAASDTPLTRPKAPGSTWGKRLAAVLFVALAAFFGSAVATWAYQALRAEPAPRGPETVLRPTPSVITAIRDLATLETASFHIERVIDLRDRQSHVFGLVESEDAILLVAAGDVTAGVDLTALREVDVTLDEQRKRASITLPLPVVLSARLDSELTYVHSRTTGALARRGDSLETRARQKAERTLREAAINGGILRRAQANAARAIETLVASLGFEQVEVRFREE